MNNVREHGKAPFSVAVLHGGPGAAGEMLPVARELSNEIGILEPFQTALSIKEQIEELNSILEIRGEHPITLIGFSWGAWLAFLYTSAYPQCVKKLILVSSGPFKSHYAEKIYEDRMSRLTPEERNDVLSISQKYVKTKGTLLKSDFEKLGTLFTKADAYDPLLIPSLKIDFRPDIFQKVWGKADHLRRSGELLLAGKTIQCPVVAIHGDYDPHPAEGVQKPLSSIFRDFRFILLKKCGHRPWNERSSRDVFFKILKDEIKS